MTPQAKKVGLALAVLALALAALGVQAMFRFPSDRTPEGAYLRIVIAVNRGAPAEFFAYTEERTQHAAYTILDYRRRALERARASYPEEALKPIEAAYGPFAAAPDGKDVFALYAEREGWLEQLRRDLSGIRKVEISGERASVVTVRGTRYAFRRRPGGIWGLTAFSATLGQEAEKAARDLSIIEAAAADYERAKAAATPRR